MELFTLFAKIGLKSDEFNSGIDSAKGKMDGMATAVQKDADAIQAKLLKFSAIGGGALLAVGGYATKVGMDFEASMSKVGAISGASSEDMARLGEKAKEMGAATVFSASQSAEAFQYMAMAGWKTEEMLSGIGGIMNLAAASGESLALTSDIVTDALTAMGLKASDAGHFADVLAAASSNSNTNVAMMGETFKYAAPLAGALGYSIEDTAVAIGLMANSGIKASQAGTSMRSMLTNLANPTDKMGAAMDALGISLVDAENNMKPLNQLMGEMRQAFNVSGVEVSNLAIELSEMSDAQAEAYLETQKMSKAAKDYAMEQRDWILASDGLNGNMVNLTESVKVQMAATIAGKNAMSGFLAILNATEDDFGKLTEAVNTAEGTAQRMADTMIDNLAGSLKIFGSAAEGVGIQLYEKLQMPLRNAVDAGTRALQWLSANLDAVITVVKTAAIAVGTFTAAWTIGNTIQKATAAINAAKTAIAAATAVTGANTTVLGANAAAEAVRTAAISAGMTVNAAGQVITKAGTVATAAETAALLSSTGAITGKTLVVGVLTGKIGLATAAQWLWNAAMTANPIGIIIAGVAALAAGIVLLVKHLNKESEASKKLREENERLKKTTDALTESVSKNKETYESRVNSINAEIGASKNLVSAITELSAIENKSAEEKQRMATYVDMLNRSMEGLNVQYDIERDALSQTVGEIERLVEARAEQARAAAAQERAVEVAREQIIVEEQLAGVRAQMTAMEDAGLATVERKIGHGKDYIMTVTETSKAYGELLEQEAELIEQGDALADSFEFVTDIIVESTMRSSEAVTSFADETEEASERAARVAEAQADAQRKALESLADEYDKVKVQATNAYDVIKQNSVVSIGEMNANLKENQETVRLWSEGIDNLTKRGVDEGMIQTLRDAGPAAAEQVAALVAASDEELKELSINFQAGGVEAVHALANVFGVDHTVALGAQNLARSTGMSLRNQIRSEDFPGSGQSIAEGLAVGIRNGTFAPVNAARDMVYAAAAAARAASQQASPSKLFAKIGKNDSEGYALGLDSMKTRIADIGKNVSKEFAQGIESMAHLVERAVDGVFGDPRHEVELNSTLSTQAPKMGDIANWTLPTAVMSDSAPRGAHPSFTYAPNITNYISDELDIKRINRIQTREMMNEMRSRGLVPG